MGARLLAAKLSRRAQKLESLGSMVSVSFRVIRGGLLVLLFQNVTFSEPPEKSRRCEKLLVEFSFGSRKSSNGLLVAAKLCQLTLHFKHLFTQIVNVAAFRF